MEQLICFQIAKKPKDLNTSPIM